MSLARFANLFGPHVVRGLNLAWRLLLGVCLAAASLLLLAWLTLHWGILPHIDDWRPRIEALATRSVGAPVRIGRIEVRSGGWVPAFHLHQVALLDAQGREALKLPHVSSALSVPALLGLELRFAQLLIEDAELEIRRDAQGRIRVAGLDMGQGGGDDTALVDWFFEQHEFVIRRGTLRWTDELRQAPPLALTDVQLVVRNGLRRHDLRLDATPPADWGDRFTLRARLRQPLLARAGDWRHWSGELHAELPRAEVGQLRRHVDLPVDLQQGRGALRLWAELRDGQLRSATADVALRDVSARLGATVEPLTVATLSGRLSAERQGDQTRLVAGKLMFATGDGVVWPESNLELTLRHAAGGAPGLAAPVVAGELVADRVELSPLAAIVGRLPVGDGVRRILAGMAPQGRVQGLTARWDGPLDAPRQYQVKALFKGVAINAAPAPQGQGVGRPGVRQADIDLTATEGGGEARLVVADGTLEFPGVFEQPVVPFKQLDAQLSWRITPDPRAGQPPQVELQVKQARFVTDDAEGDLAGRWHTGAQPGFGKGLRLPGVLDIAGKLTRGKATSVARYLPQGLPKTARDYVQRAVLAGEVAAASFKVKGDLWAFPFYNASEGEFNITAQARDVTLAYVPSVPAGAGSESFDSPWPAFDKVSGTLEFSGRSMTVRDAQARLWGLTLSGFNGRIADFADSVLQIEGQARGPLADLLRYVNATPVGTWTSQALAPASAGGVADLRIALALPLRQLAQTTVNGSVSLAGNDVRLRPDLPTLEGARGRVEFTHKGLQVVGASARVLGGEATFDGGTQPDGTLRFQGQGIATAEALRRPGGLPAVVTRIAAVARGQAPFKLQLDFVKGWPEVLVTSPLTGMAIDLPAPLGKPAEGQLPLRVQTSMAPESLAAGQAPRDQLRVEVGPMGQVGQAVWQRDLSHDHARVLRSAMAVNAPLPAPVPGGHAVADVGAVNVDAWQQALDRILAPGPGGGAPAGAADADDYLPASIALKAGELVAGQRRVTRLVLALTRQQADGETTWRGNVDADQMGGYVEYRRPRAATQAGRVYARLARLSLPPTDAQAVEGLLDQAPASVPALDIVVDDFELRGKKLGRVELEAVNRGVALGADALREAPREWRLTRLSLQTPEATLTGSGRWAAAAGSTRRRMVLDFKLDMADSGALLERLGFGRVIKGGKGRLGGQVAWDGSPLALDTPSMDGQMSLALDAGQFLKADVGAARLLGVVSLQALPRRLLLDFRDVFQEGFAFDNVAGDLRIERGVAATNNLRMRGVQAAVLMEGKADIVRETQDLRVVVVPEVNAGTASLAYAAINPAVGLTTFLAQWLLRRPLQSANTREFHVTGPWADPKVERVERKPGEPAPDIDAPAAAASVPPRTP